MAYRYQNQSHTTGRVPSYYANNKQYPGAYARTDVPGRVSRRVHDGFDLTRNYGLDTTSDDINSSPYSSPYYVNGRYNADNLTTQRANSSSVQGIKRLLTPIYGKDTNDTEYIRFDDFTAEDQQDTIEIWQGKQIKFEIPYDGKVVGNTIELKNTDGCTGVLSIYFSTEKDGVPVYETSVDLCKVSQDVFEHLNLYSILTIAPLANPHKKLYVRMEIWDEVILPPDDRNRNPFNTGKKIEIAATGKGNHEACVYQLEEKDKMVNEHYDYKPYPSRPLIGLIYSDWESVPVDRLDNIKTGATVSLNKYRYDIFCVKKNGIARIIVYDKELNKIVKYKTTEGDVEVEHEAGLRIKIDGRVTQLNIAQVTDTNKVTWVYYVDGYSPLQRFKIGEWVSEDLGSGSSDNTKAKIDQAIWFQSEFGNTAGTYVFVYNSAMGGWLYNSEVKDMTLLGITLIGGKASEGATITVNYTISDGGTKNVESIQYVDPFPAVGASLIMFHNNRLYLAGFRGDPNLVQISSIEAEGPDYRKFPYRFYAPNRSPYDTTLNPITALTEYASDQIMISFKNGFSIYSTYGSSSSVGLEDNIPVQVSTFMDSSGVQSQGDICNYKGVLYSFDEKEGLRRYTGALWNSLPTTVDSHYDRVDMSRPRKIWGFSNKLYFNYYDKLDGKAKCLIWDQQMNYQQMPWFQDVDIPFCDVRYDESEDLIGIHPDYPCIMQLYAEDTWARLDSPIVFRRDSKFLSLPGNAADIIVKRVHVKVLANSNRWWWLSILTDKQQFAQYRGVDHVYRQPSWDTLVVKEPAETPFPVEDVFERDAVYRLSIMSLRIECESVQVRMKTKTFRNQANLLSVLVEVQPKNYL